MQTLFKGYMDNGTGTVLEKMHSGVDGAWTRFNNMNPNAPVESSTRAQRDAEMMMFLENDLHSEIADRNPDDYFTYDGIMKELLDNTESSNVTTESAEIDLENAKQDRAVFATLFEEYNLLNENHVPMSIKREDFAPVVDKFVDDRTTQINQLIAESKTIAKGTPEYAENEAKRKKLAKERSSAKRLNDKYLNAPKAETPASKASSGDEMSMEQMPDGKAKEQTKTETRELQEEQSPTSYHFEGGVVDKDATITVGQEIPDEWFESKTYGDSTGSGFGINITRPPQIEDYLSQALNIEFGKLSEDERQQYDYPALSKAIITEARKTRRVPNIASIINHQRAVNEQREKVEQSYDRRKQ